MNNVDYALQYSQRGWAVFPLHSAVNGTCTCGKDQCSSAGKHPRTFNGVKSATNDAFQIQRWWERWPEANIGIATGESSGIVVLDVDPRHGGDDSLRELIKKHGELPDTIIALTGGDGQHILFAHPGKEIRNRTGIMDGLDIRADGGYIVASPSIHASGKHYEWEINGHPDDTPLAEIPDWLLNVVMYKKKSANKAVVRTSNSLARWGYDGAVVGYDTGVGSIPEGGRNARLTSLAGSMRAKGMGEQAIIAALLAHNLEQCSPPLPDYEVRNIAHSVSRYAAGGQVTQTVRMPGNVMVACPSVDTFFDGKSFVPARVAAFILDNSHWFIQGTELYVYEHGVYNKSGDRELQRLVQEVLGERSRKNLVQEAVYFVQNSLRSNKAVVNPDDGLLNVSNGLLNWRTGELLPHGHFLACRRCKSLLLITRKLSAQRSAVFSRGYCRKMPCQPSKNCSAMH